MLPRVAAMLTLLIEPLPSLRPRRPPHEHLEDLAGGEEVVKTQILKLLHVICGGVHVAPKKAPGFLGYSSSSSIFWFGLLPLARIGSGGASPYRLLLPLARIGSGGASPYHGGASPYRPLVSRGFPIVLVVVVLGFWFGLWPLARIGSGGASPYRLS
jgi:hypothetical protein